MARLDKPQGPRPTIYSRDAVRGWLKQIDAVVDFDFDAYLEARPELCDGIPADHNLNDDHEFVISYYPDPSDTSPVVTPPRLADFAEAYTKGVMTARRKLRLQDRTWFSLEPMNELARSLEDIEAWNEDKLAIRDMAAEDDQWSVWLERGLTPFAFGLLREGGLESDVLPAYSEWNLLLVVKHAHNADGKTVEAIASRFLFELAAASGILLRIDSYPSYEDYPPETPNIYDKPFAKAYHDGDLTVRSLPVGPGASEITSLWLRGKYLDDPAAALVTFVRVIEYVSATVSRQESHLRLRLLLGTEDAVSLSSGFLDQLLNESERFVRIRRSDADLVRLTVQTCCVPSILARKTNLVLPKLTTKLESDKNVDSSAALAEFARIVFSTRNSLVHAKSNYSPTGNEIAEADLPSLLPAVEHAALMAIRWFLQQPPHVRVA